MLWLGNVVQHLTQRWFPSCLLVLRLVSRLPLKMQLEYFCCWVLQPWVCFHDGQCMNGNWLCWEGRICIRVGLILLPCWGVAWVMFGCRFCVLDVNSWCLKWTRWEKYITFASVQFYAWPVFWFRFKLFEFSFLSPISPCWRTQTFNCTQFLISLTKDFPFLIV